MYQGLKSPTARANLGDGGYEVPQEETWIRRVGELTARVLDDGGEGDHGVGGGGVEERRQGGHGGRQQPVARGQHAQAVLAAKLQSKVEG